MKKLIKIQPLPSKSVFCQFFVHKVLKTQSLKFAFIQYFLDLNKPHHLNQTLYYTSDIVLLTIFNFKH